MATQKDRIRNRRLKAYGIIAIAVLLVIAIIILIISAIAGGPNNPGVTASPTPIVTASPTAPGGTTEIPTDGPTDGVTDGPTDGTTDSTPGETTPTPTTKPTATTKPTGTPKPTTPPASLTENKYGMTGVTELNFRKETNTSSSIIRKLDKGVAVMVLKLEQGDGTWTQIQVGDDIGFVKTEYLKAAPMQPSCKVNVNDSMNVRKEPGTSSEKIAELAKDAKVTIVRYIDSEWVQIKMEDGSTGYCTMRYLKEA